ncbi:MAG: type II secretion system protein [Candidatus Doudnabacteria bacterium]|nr:type II secretion system protein [Candidatus Doudnabacteria bacterium]
MLQKYKNKNSGFTLIEILVVVAIIALLSSIALIGLMSAREKSRNVKRLGDMTQMNTALELYNAQNKGYPPSVNGVPQGMTPTFLTGLPRSPIPPDGFCDITSNPAGLPSNDYYYTPTGTSSLINGVTVWSDYIYYFCLGGQTGNFGPGLRILTPKGVR